MAFSNSYSYGNRSIFDLKTILKSIRFIVVNSILVLIFLFLTVEEFEWTIFSSIEGIKDKVIDETSWNIKAFI